MERLVRPVAVERLPTSGRRAGRLAVVGLVLLALAVAKPWSAAPGGRPGAGDRTSGIQAAHPGEGPPRVATLQSPSPRPWRSPGPDEIVCLGSWELVALSHLGTWNSREWLPVHPQLADGPLDPRLAEGGGHLDGTVRAVGVCGDQESTGTAISVRSAWRIVAGQRAVQIEVRTVPTRAEGGAGDLARLYRPAELDASAPWPVGRYELELASATGGGAGWLALDVGGTG